MDKENLPKHIAIIPDGNRRWAKIQGLLPWIGHYQGAKNLERLLKEVILPLKIPHFSLWIASFDNLEKRPTEEVEKLCGIFADYFVKLVDHKDIHKHQVRITAFGEWERKFPKQVVTAVNNAQEKTKEYSNYFLNFFMAYDGQREMLSAINELAGEKEKITADLLKSHLWTKDLPPVDLLIRTGVKEDPHLSGGFLMWHTLYSQLYFSPLYFPDFGPEKFKEAIKNYSMRERRFGG